MGWPEIVGLIVRVGLPTALKIYDIWRSNPELTEEAVARLRELNKETLQSVIDQTQ